MLVSRKYRTWINGVGHYIKGHPKCGELHGHNYEVEVEVFAEELYMDFGYVKSVVDRILLAYDHTNITEKMSISTCEELGDRIAQEIGEELDRDVSVTLWETNNFGIVAYFNHNEDEANVLGI